MCLASHEGQATTSTPNDDGAVRYDIGARDGGMVPHPAGEWVTLEDHGRIVTAQREALAAQAKEVDRLRSEVELWKGAHGRQTMATFDAMVAERDEVRARLASSLDGIAGRDASILVLESQRDQARQDLERVKADRDRAITDWARADHQRDEAIAERDALRGEVGKARDLAGQSFQCFQEKRLSEGMVHLASAVEVLSALASTDQASGGGK